MQLSTIMLTGSMLLAILTGTGSGPERDGNPPWEISGNKVYREMPAISHNELLHGNPATVGGSESESNIHVHLSLEEEAELKAKNPDAKGLKRARAKLIEYKKQEIRSMIAFAKAIVDSDTIVWRAFVDFSGIDPVANPTRWKNLWEENKAGPSIHVWFSGRDLAADTQGDTINFYLNDYGQTVEGAFILLHEYVHVGDKGRGPGGSFDGQGTEHIRKHSPVLAAYGDEVLLGGLQEIFDFYKDSEILGAEYLYYLDCDKQTVINVEIGCAFEKAAFGAIINKRNLQAMIQKYSKQ